MAKRFGSGLGLSLLLILALVFGSVNAGSVTVAAETEDGVAPGEFSIVVMPDSQAMANKRSPVFHGITQWIVDNAEKYNIQMVLHNGDVIDNGQYDIGQYDFALDAMNIVINAGIPFNIAIGNHDYDNEVLRSRRAGLFNYHFGKNIYDDKPWFRGTYQEGAYENHYSELEIEGQKFLFFALEFGPRDEVLEWFEQIVAAHPDHKVIVNTHSYLFLDGTRVSPGDAHNPKDYPGADEPNDGEDMWEKVLKHHANILAVFNGHHIVDPLAYRVDLGVHGNPVLQSFQNWQMSVSGKIRLVTFNLAEQTARMQVVDTETGQFVTGPGHDVTVPIQAGIPDPDIVFPRR